MSPSRSHERTMAVVWRRYFEVRRQLALLRASIWRMADFARKSAFSASSAPRRALSSSGASTPSTSARAISTTSQSSAAPVRASREEPRPEGEALASRRSQKRHGRGDEPPQASMALRRALGRVGAGSPGPRCPGGLRGGNVAEGHHLASGDDSGQHRLAGTAQKDHHHVVGRLLQCLQKRVGGARAQLTPHDPECRSSCRPEWERAPCRPRSRAPVPPDTRSRRPGRNSARRGACAAKMRPQRSQAPQEPPPRPARPLRAQKRPGERIGGLGLVEPAGPTNR